MSSPEVFTLLGITLVLAGLIGILILAVVRLRRGRLRQQAGTRVSEEAFMATTIQDALAERSERPATTDAPRVRVDTAIVEALPLAVLVVDEAGLLRRFNRAASELLGVKIAQPLPVAARHALAAHPAIIQAVEAARVSVGPSMTHVDLPVDDAWRTIK